ncbi:MAG: CtsR family transcriptional regulator [Clostridia bacterium]|nr:CtsR family transcriptional regulator [Clostridia bacterium]
MSNISNIIENYLKELLKDGHGQAEIQRNELAGQFRCVPSQINYVLNTRFSVEHGYLIESRRGGGGFVRIVKLIPDDRFILLQELLAQIGDNIGQRLAESILSRLLGENILTQREYELMKAALKKEFLKLERSQMDKVRAEILKSMLLVLLK